MTRRRFLLGASGAAACSRSRRRLNVFNWSDYIAPETLTSFEAEFGVRVRYGVFQSAEEMLAKVLGGNSGWDVVFPPNSYIGPMRELGLLARLEPERLRHLDQLAAPFRSPAWDPELSWSVPYMFGGTGILYNRRLAPPPQSWAALWEDRLQGRLTMLDDPAEVFGACLKKIGSSVNSTEPAELRRAQGEAIAQKRLLRAYLNTEVRDQVVAGDVLAAQIWSGDAYKAVSESPDLDFAFPTEGFPLYADNAAILRESARPELAHQFLDYLLRPEVAAGIVRTTLSASANAGARRLLPEEIRNNPTLYPAESVMERGEWLEALPPQAQRLRDRLWTEIKSA